MDPLYTSFAGAIARWAVTLAIGFLVAHHIVAVDQTAYFTEGFTHQLVMALPLLLPLLWSLWGKYKGRVRFLTALEAPAGTTESSVNARIENGMGASVKAGAVLLACVLAGAAALSMPGCGPKQYHTAVVANTSIAQAIFAVQDAEIAAHQAQLITDAKHAAYKAQILTLLEAGDDLTLALKDWNPSQPVPANVGVAIGHVQQLLNDLQLNSPQASALLFTVQTVLSVLRGSGVLPGDDAARDSLATEPPIMAVDPRDQTIGRSIDAVFDPGLDSRNVYQRDRLRQEPRRERRWEQPEETASADHALMILLAEVARG